MHSRMQTVTAWSGISLAVVSYRALQGHITLIFLRWKLSIVEYTWINQRGDSCMSLWLQHTMGASEMLVKNKEEENKYNEKRSVSDIETVKPSLTRKWCPYMSTGQNETREWESCLGDFPFFCTIARTPDLHEGSLKFSRHSSSLPFLNISA